MQITEVVYGLCVLEAIAASVVVTPFLQLRKLLLSSVARATHPPLAHPVKQFWCIEMCEHQCLVYLFFCHSRKMAAYRLEATVVLNYTLIMHGNNSVLLQNSDTANIISRSKPKNFCEDKSMSASQWCQANTTK
jgi:hypothetical protein